MLRSPLNIEVLFDDPIVVVAGLHSPWARRPKFDARMDYLCHGSSSEFVRSLHPGMLPVVLNHMRQALPSASNYATQMLGTATFWNRCGEATTEEG
jgi:hypothetical protein